jgi:hypothetical protein
MMWSTPSSRKAHVVARSAVAGGIGGSAVAGFVDAIAHEKVLARDLDGGKGTRTRRM